MKLQHLNEMLRSDIGWLKPTIAALKERRERAVQEGMNTLFMDGLIIKLEKALKAAELAKESVNEGKTYKDAPKKPRAKRLSDILKGRKGGAMPDKKKDYVRAKEKQKMRKEMNEADDFGGQDPYELYRDSREHIRQSINHLNRILSYHYDRGPRYEHPDRDTLHRMAKAASVVDNAAHILAAGTTDDKPDPMDV